MSEPEKLISLDKDNEKKIEFIKKQKDKIEKRLIELNEELYLFGDRDYEFLDEEEIEDLPNGEEIQELIDAIEWYQSELHWLKCNE